MKKLISFVGKGRRDAGDVNTYQKTEYAFADDVRISTAIFPEALIQYRKPEIAEAVLIGTYGSSWGCLLERHDHCFDLYERLEQGFERQVVSNDMLGELGQALSGIWQIPVTCYAHSSEITEENALQILFEYMNCISETQCADLLLDITHGFRSMPVILMGAVQLLDAVLPSGVSLQIIYGELNQQGPSPVRYLEAVWDGIRFGRAMREFNEKFEAERLAEFLEKDWQQGSRAVRRLSAVLQANYVTRMDEVLSQLKNAIDAAQKEPVPGEQTMMAVRQLEQLHRRLSARPHLHQRILVLAELFAERKLWGQAITTLQLALEAFSFHVEGEDDWSEEYEVTKKVRAAFMKRLQKGANERNRDHRQLMKLNAARNAIAHGGAFTARGGKPQEASLPSQFSSYRDCLTRVFKSYGGK
jgi:CRISPR-associated Csx2 family protein